VSGRAPTDQYERLHGAPTGKRICGIDEAGRGPLAGPVLASAVVLDWSKVPDGLADSKKLTELKRAELKEALEISAEIGIGLASVEEINRLNILAATLLAMRRAVEDLPKLPDFALIDGNQMPDLPCPGETIVKGDQKSLSVAAASIIAKETRDAMMRRLANEFPDYGWERNKGYGTKAHLEGLKNHGVTRHHRRFFAPVSALLEGK
jgi:ribonuclease HII